MAPNEMTFWKGSYDRHTNFAIGEIENPFNTSAGFGRQKMQATISRSGDLLSSIYVYTQLPAITYLVAHPAVPGTDSVYYTNAVGNAMIQDCKVVIGTQQIDSMSGEFMEIFETLSTPAGKDLSEMVGRYAGVAGLEDAAMRVQDLYTPLQFWFNRFYEQVLPMIGLYWHETRIEMQTRTMASCLVYQGAFAANHADLTWMSPPTDVTEMHLLCNFVYLDKAERAAFANGKHQYVFDQLEYLGEISVTAAGGLVQHDIRFSQPVQELVWVCQRDAVLNIDVATYFGSDFFNFSGATVTIPFTGGHTVPTEPFVTAQLLLNNQQRTIAHTAKYYRCVQPYQAHARTPDRYIYCYCFGTAPELMLDTGSVNMSRMDNAKLNIVYPTAAGETWAGKTRIYARKKNVAKVAIGMFGQKFA
jgi:hypothetical protein